MLGRYCPVEALFPHCSSPDIHNLSQLEVQSEDQASLHNPQSIRLLFIEVWSTWPVPRCLDKNCRHLHNDTLRTKPTTPDLYMEVVRAMECLCSLLHVSPPVFKPPFCLFGFIYERRGHGHSSSNHHHGVPTEWRRSVPPFDGRHPHPYQLPAEPPDSHRQCHQDWGAARHDCLRSVGVI